MSYVVRRQSYGERKQERIHEEYATEIAYENKAVHREVMMFVYASLSATEDIVLCRLAKSVTPALPRGGDNRVLHCRRFVVAAEMIRRQRKYIDECSEYEIVDERHITTVVLQVAEYGGRRTP